MSRRLLIILVLLLLPWFFIGGPDYYASRLFREVWNLGHIVFFALAGYLLLSLSMGPLRTRVFKGLWLVVVFSLVVGWLIEVAQYGSAREPDSVDVLRDLLGGLIAYLVFFSSQWQQRLALFNSLLLIALVAVVLQLTIIGLLAGDELRMQRAFPVLADFETVTELTRWSGDAQFSQSSEYVEHGEYSLKVVVAKQPFSGVALRYLESDWRNYQQLLVAVYNPDPEAFPVVLRIDDVAHRQGEQLFSDRFNRRFEVLHGWNQWVIALTDIASAPNTRQLDLENIGELHFFMVNPEPDKTFYLDHVRLR
ncbi:VanZ family protein [Oceanicoccus sp. KOV_DT_Chl]|uniref:VanZ family protein n=1 Tax=Oceanicoccus sp. KOV_DT_Chl TaxID=1904639 RepID=UPI000C7A855B|nr:VanZ family protein [Oceanicoccus sp. KOV_DT_Chl]